MQPQQPSDHSFSRRGAWMGFFAYVVLALIVASIFIF